MLMYKQFKENIKTDNIYEQKTLHFMDDIPDNISNLTKTHFIPKVVRFIINKNKDMFFQIEGHEFPLNFIFLNNNEFVIVIENVDLLCGYKYIYFGLNYELLYSNSNLGYGKVKKPLPHTLFTLKSFDIDNFLNCIKRDLFDVFKTFKNRPVNEDFEDESHF